MFKAFLCIIPRNKPARSVYTVICTFLNQNLSRFDQPNHEKIFYLWYVTIREYSSVQQCDQLYVDIFEVTKILFTQYDLQQVNSNSMLQLILADFCNFDTQKVSATIHNSILAIINRYLILYRDSFLAYL